MARNPHKNPNPQGKGLVAVLSDWQATRPRAPQAKAPGELLLDWFVSALVLSARFSFRPVVGQHYWLYSRDGQWQLSLVAPKEWGERDPGVCLGRCELREDMTWTLVREAELDGQAALREELAVLIEGFTTALASDAPLEAHLPGYRRDLPYYQRLLATALGRSLRSSAAGGAGLAAPARVLLAEAGAGFGTQLLAGPQSRS